MNVAEPWELPADWRWSRFDGVARIASNLVDPAEYGSYPHVAPNHIESETGRLLPYATVAEDGVTSPKHKFLAGQVLYSKIRPYLAKVVVVDFDGLCSADMYPLETELEPRFLKWWMLTQQFTVLAAGQQARTVLPKINARALNGLPVPVPPPYEQRRIVDLLEDHLSRLEAAHRLLTRAGSWTIGLQSAWLAAQPDVADAEQRPLATLLASPLRHGRSVPTADRGFPVLRLTALRGPRVDLGERKEGAWTATEAEPFLVSRGDFLVARGSGSLHLVGRGALVDVDPDPVAYPDTAIRVRVAAEIVEPKFLALVWNSPPVRAQIEAAARTTAGIHKVNQADLSRLILPVPSLESQRDLVQRATELAASGQRLSHGVQTARRRANVLRRGLLAAAFSGGLGGASSSVRQPLNGVAL